METNESNKEVQVIQSGLALHFTDTGVADMKKQRLQFELFVREQMRRDVDHGIIKGTEKPSLWKAGAEKLAGLFGLGSRIIKMDKEIDWDKNRATFFCTIELYHIQTGKVIAQCEAICTSQELKYREHTPKTWDDRSKKYTYGNKEPRPIGDLLNTLIKMVQKRAFVGAVIIATRASDFFNHDLTEDEETFHEENPDYHAKQHAVQEEMRAWAHAINTKPAPQSKAVDDSFENFQGVGFKPAPKDFALDPTSDERKKLNVEIAAERKRLEFTPTQLGQYIYDNFQKKPSELSNEEMSMLVTALRRTNK
jgi:hypothetical protein